MRGNFFYSACLSVLSIACLVSGWKSTEENIGKVQLESQKMDAEYAVSAEGETKEVIAGGFPVGIYLKAEGAYVLGVAGVTDIFGVIREPCREKLQPGDSILEVNGETICTKQEFLEKVQMCNGNALELTVLRKETRIRISVTPVWSAEGMYRLGVWLRDDTQGIGTMTYLLSDGSFGALGHPITDIDTGQKIDISEGGLFRSSIQMIMKPVDGMPGSLSGFICYSRDSYLGTITANTDFGVFGKMENLETAGIDPSDTIPIAEASEVTLGAARIRCTILSQKKDYAIEITELHPEKRGQNGIVFRITDEELLAQTGGILRGMSGAMIIQNGKLAGAVTHVFIRDSTSGYGVFIREMLEEEKKAESG